MQKSPFTVEIINIGEELLIGKVINTNASWLSKKIIENGGKVRRITVISDDINEIASALIEAISRKPNLIITTGGLGPTYDDKTVFGIAKALGRKVELNKEALRKIEETCKRKGVKLNEARRKMAYLPSGCKIIENPIGLAPGILIEVEGVKIIALPGVPNEMKEMFNKSVVNIVKSGKYHEVELHVKNVYEADLAPIIKELAEKNPQIYLKSHPSIQENKPYIILHIYSNGKLRDEILKICEKLKMKITELGGEVIKIIGDEPCTQ